MSGQLTLPVGFGGGGQPQGMYYQRQQVPPSVSNAETMSNSSSAKNLVQLQPVRKPSLSSSTGGSGTRQPPQQAGYDRRIAWLEEDVAVLVRRLRDECGEGYAGGGAGDPGLRALVARLDGELSAERRVRQSLEERMTKLESVILQEKKERELQLRVFSNDLEKTMRTLISRIDEGLSVGAASMRGVSDDAEARLSRMLKRVDDGLGAGSGLVQDTQSSIGAYSPPERSTDGRRPNVAARNPNERAAAEVPPQTIVNGREVDSSDMLIQSWDRLRQENVRLRQQQGRTQPIMQGVSPVQGITPAATPSLAYPSTLQVPGSGLAQMPTRMAPWPTQGQLAMRTGPAGYGSPYAAPPRHPASRQ